MTELVSREMYLAMVAERDALAARVVQLESEAAVDMGDVNKLIDDRNRLTALVLTLRKSLGQASDELYGDPEARIGGWKERAEIAECDLAKADAENDRLTASLAAAHGLQARAERAEAAGRANICEAREAFQLIREVVEDLASPGAVAEVVEPPFMMEAEALVNGVRDIDRRAERAEAALRKIADGITDSDAPDVMKLEPADFRSGMWSWSQRVALAALAAVPS